MLRDSSQFTQLLLNSLVPSQSHWPVPHTYLSHTLVMQNHSPPKISNQQIPAFFVCLFVCLAAKKNTCQLACQLTTSTASSFAFSLLRRPFLQFLPYFPSPLHAAQSAHLTHSSIEFEAAHVVSSSD